jgi:hypothetical protein
MKSQSTEYPTTTQYDSDHISVPINITETSKLDPMGNTQTGYEYELMIVPATSLTQNKELINAICQAIILDKFSLIYQANVANGLYPEAGMKTWIADMVAESNRCTDLLELNQTAVPAWPVYEEVT